MSQEETAGLSSISLRHMINIETVKTKLSLSTLIAIVDALDIYVDFILCDCDDYKLKIVMNTVLSIKESLSQDLDFRKILFKNYNFN